MMLFSPGGHNGAFAGSSFRGLAQSQIVIYVVCLCCQSVDRDNGR